MTDLATHPFRPLEPREVARSTTIANTRASKLRPMVPPPAGVAPATGRTLRRHAPPSHELTKVWKYLDAAGDLLHYVARFDGADGREFKPFCWCADEETGEADWRPKSAPTPRPLYGLDRLAARPFAPVLVCEGEKAADGAAARFPEYVTVTSPGGSNASAYADWSALRGRDVVIWPDNDTPGRAHADAVRRLALGAGASSVRVVAVPVSFPAAWDLADENPEGWDADLLAGLLGAAGEHDGATDASAPALSLSAPAPAHREPERIPLYPPLPDAASFPIDALGPLLGSAALAIASKVQIADAIAAQSVLSVAALAAQQHADVMLPYGQTRPLSLFLMTVAASGDRKSTADNEALWPVSKREKDLREQAAAETKAWRMEHAAWAAEKKKIEGERKIDQGERLDRLTKLGDEPPRPLEPFLITGDLTFEGLAKCWPDAHASLGVFSAEGGSFTGGHGFSDEARIRTAASLCKVWDGKVIERLRSKDGVIILPGRRLSLHVMVQHEVAAQFLSDPILRDQGLLSRILVVAPETKAGTRFYRDPSPEDDRAIRTYGARVLSLLEAPPRLVDGSRNQLDPRALTIAADATALWRDFYDSVEAQCGTGGALVPIRDFAAKVAEHAARIAGVLAILEHADTEAIDRDTMERAVAIADFYVGEAVRLAQASRTDPRLIKAQALLDWMGQHAAPEVSFRDLLRLGPSALRTKSAMEDALAVLTAHGWVSETASRPRAFRFNGER